MYGGLHNTELCDTCGFMAKENKNANVYLYKGKDSKDYIKCDLFKSDGGTFTFCVSPKFLNKKQFAYLMRLLENGKSDNK